MSTTLRSVSSIFSSASSADALAPVSTCTPPNVCHCALRRELHRLQWGSRAVGEQSRGSTAFIKFGCRNCTTADASRATSRQRGALTGRESAPPCRAGAHAVVSTPAGEPSACAGCAASRGRPGRPHRAIDFKEEAVLNLTHRIAVREHLVACTIACIRPASPCTPSGDVCIGKMRT